MKLQQFCTLGGILHYEAGVQRSVRQEQRLQGGDWERLPV